MSQINTPPVNFSQLPSRAFTHKLADELIELLFPADAAFAYKYETPDEKRDRLKNQLTDLLVPVLRPGSWTPEQVAQAFFEQLPALYDDLIQDASFFLQSDPAADSIEEVIVAYPGFYAITIYRLAHLLYNLQVPVLPRLISEYAHTRTGIDIHPGAQISVPFFIDHGTGVVIGQTTVIGSSVKIYQGVTLGALAVRKEQQNAKRHPTIEDRVIIYAGSCILGGQTIIGHDTVIGGNVWLTESVPPLSFVYHKSDVTIRDKSEMNEVIEFVI